MQKFNLIVAGGRKFTDYAWLTTEIHRICDAELNDYLVSIVSGMAKGVDQMAWRFCQEYNVNCIEMPAMWDDIMIEGAVIKYHGDGRAYNVKAGNDRNTKMQEIGHGLLAFWDGHSTGTKDMIHKMTVQTKPVRVIRY